MSVLPGYRHYYGHFDTQGDYGYRWSSTDDDSSDAWGRVLNLSNSDVYRYFTSKDYGLSVVCTKSSSDDSNNGDTNDINAADTSATAGEEGTIEVTATDEFGNVVEGETISVEDAADLDGLEGTEDTGENGVATFTFNEETADDYTPEFSAETDGVANDTATVTVNPADTNDCSIGDTKSISY